MMSEVSKNVSLQHIKIDDVQVIEAGMFQLVEGELLDRLLERGFTPLLCCGSGVEQLIGIYHHERVKLGATVTCPRCRIVHTFRELAEPIQYLGGIAKAFVRPDGTYAIGL